MSELTRAGGQVPSMSPGPAGHAGYLAAGRLRVPITKKGASALAPRRGRCAQKEYRQTRATQIFKAEVASIANLAQTDCFFPVLRTLTWRSTRTPGVLQPKAAGLATAALWQARAPAATASAA